MIQRPTVSIIIPTRDRKEKLLRLLESVQALAYPSDRLETIVVDNGSSDGTAAAVASDFPSVKLIRNEGNLYCAGGRNVGLEAATSDFLFFVDDDNILDHACVDRLVEAFEADERLGVVAPLMLHHGREGIIWCAGGFVDRWGLVSYLFAGSRLSDADLPPIVDCDFFPNSYMLRGVAARRGLAHDTANFPHNWCEADLCERARKMGYRTALVTSAVTRHDIDYAGRLTRVGVDKTIDQARSRVRFRRKYRNSPLAWAAFFLVIFPFSTLIYLKAFALQRDEPFMRLFGAYMKGTMQGFFGRL